MSQTKTTDMLTKNALSNLWRNTNFGVWVVLFVLFCALIYMLRSVLMPFVLGIVLGYLFDPLVSKLTKFKISRTWATLLVFVLVLLLITPLLVWFIGTINDELNLFISMMPEYMSVLAQKIMPLLERLQASFPSLSAENIKETLSQNISETFQFSGKLLQSLFKNGMAIVNVLSLVLITPVVAFYMLRDWDVFTKKAKDLLPKKSKKNLLDIFRQIDRALSGFIRGQVSVCIILGAYYAVGLRLVGLELGLLVGFIAGIISFIPYVGSITGFVLSMILACSQFGDMTHIIAVVCVFFIGQFIEGNFLTPKLVGDKVGLHPVWVMFALLSGGALLGFLGLMIAVPVAAVIGVLIRAGLKKYQKSSLYLS